MSKVGDPRFDVPVNPDEEAEKRAWMMLPDQMIHNMTPQNRQKKGFPPYRLTEDEARRDRGNLTEQEKVIYAKVRQDSERQAKLVGEVAMRFEYRNRYYEDWTTAAKNYAMQQWKNNHPLSHQQMYDHLKADLVEPWKSIRNCIGQKPPDPSAHDQSVESYYNYLVPECGMMLDWYNDPNCNHGDLLQQARLASKFSYSVAAHIPDLPDPEPPFYFGGVVVALVALAVMAVKIF